MSFPRYPKYKDSGVEWLGQVPEHWDVISIKWLSPVKRGASPRPIDDPKYFDDEGEFAWVRIADVSACDGVLNETTQRLSELGSSLSVKIAPGELFVSIAGTVGKPCISAIKACIHDGFVYFPTLKINPLFLYRIFEGGVCYGGLGKWGTQLNLNTDTIGSIRLAVPPADELKELLDFLDRETGKIDELVAEQRRLMELLKEKRQAVISHAVTRGLNPAAPLKPSGIEWLGDVPAHWELGRVKTYFQTTSGGTPNTSQQERYYAAEENGIPWIRTTDLQNDILRSAEVFITEQALADTACTILPPGTVMVAMYGGDGTVGKNGLLAFPAAINQAVCGLLPSATHVPEYVFRFMQFYRPYWMIGAESSRKDPNISQERVRNAPFPKPPRDEQDAIVAFLGTQLQAFDTLTAEAQRAIDLLQERRTALISAAVTGQINVCQC